MGVNYRNLLKKYIEHVGLEEGTTFLDQQGFWDDAIVFTDEEWAELKRVEAEPYILLHYAGRLRPVTYWRGAAPTFLRDPICRGINWGPSESEGLTYNRSEVNCTDCLNMMRPRED